MQPRLVQILIGSALVVPLGASWAQTLNADAVRVQQVTLYPGSATVERSATVKAGSQGIEIRGIAANFDVQSLRVQGDVGIRIGEVSVRDQAKAQSVNPRAAELEAKIQSLQDQMAQLDIERRSSELVNDYLKGFGAPAEPGKGGALPVSDPRQLSGMIDGIRRGSTDSLTRIQKVELQKRELDKQVQTLNRDLQKIQALTRDTRIINIGLAADKAGQVHLSYQVNDTGWRPTYRAALDSQNAMVELERQASIAQRTGEDWVDVSLRLSTGQPRSAPQGQTPLTWNLGLASPQASFDEAPPPKMRAQPAPVSALAAKPSAERARMEQEPLFRVAEVQSAFSTEFAVPGRVSLPADGRNVTVSLSRQRIPVKLRVQVAPRLDTQAYLVAQAEQPEGVWMPGTIQLQRDDSFVGSTHWNAQQGQALILPFGRDDLVQVTVERAKQTSGQSGFIGQRNTRQINDVYTVKSRHKQAVTLWVLEASPVSTDEQIKLESRFDPPVTLSDWEQRAGVVAWQVPLEAGATRKFGVDYRISWPKDEHIQGLNR